MDEKDLCVLKATEAARKAVEALKNHAYGLARSELRAALEAMERWSALVKEAVAGYPKRAGGI